MYGYGGTVLRVNLTEGDIHRHATEARLVRAQALLAAGQAEQASALLASIPAESRLFRPARLERARVLAGMEQTEQAQELYRQLLQVDEPDEVQREAAVALLEAGVPEQAELKLLLWAHHPWGQTVVRSDKHLPRKPSWQESAFRAERLMYAGDYDGAIELLKPLASSFSGSSEGACRARYTLGRSLYKKRRYSDAAKAFGSAVDDCINTDGEYGPRIAYSHGRAEDKAGHNRTAAAVFRKMAEHWPEHRFADDGWVLAGDTLEQAGDHAGALAMFEQAITLTPAGDMVPEAIFRMAWSQYQEGEASEAIHTAERAAALPRSADRRYVDAGRYWAGRWSLYPDPHHPNQRDDAGLDAAVEHWSRLCQEQPWDYYAVLAYSRLQQEAPETAATVQGGVPPGTPPTTWALRRSFYEDPAVQNATALLALGLVREAQAEWSAVDEQALTPAEMAWWTLSRNGADDWLGAHRDMRTWMRTWPPLTPDKDAWAILRVAYPDYWWPEVQDASQGYRFPPRFLHALIRVESNFDAQAVSWAGARGLGQVMPATGRGVGKWLGIRVSADDLLDWDINLKLGSRYQEFLHQEFNDSPYLAAAGYNAGEHRVHQWLKSWGDIPSDEYVERIPFDETRNYVKRVVGTWATYRWLDGDGLPDLSRYNQHANPSP